MRRDKRGRVIGYNWWRELICSEWRCADQAWWLQMEAETMMYETEVLEFRQKCPRPTLKMFMLSLAFRHAEN